MRAIQSAIVVGGGIVGLVCATALAKRGVGVAVLERKPDVTDDGGIGMGLQGNALKALDMIGVAAPAIAAGVSAESLEYLTPAGHVAMKTPAPRYGGMEYPGFVGISRRTFHTILARAATDASVALHVNRRVQSLELAVDRATVVMQDGARVTADIVIGADGIYSAVRRTLFPAHANPQRTGEVVCRAKVTDVEKTDVFIVRGGTVGTIGFTPIGGGGNGYIYVVDRAEFMPERDGADPRQRFLDRVNGYGGAVADLVQRVSSKPEDVDWRALEVVQLPPPWYRGRAIVIGDAAHAGPPTLAQGAAMGIEDAVVLAECLDGTTDIAAAFSAFMQRRYERVRTVMEASLTISHAQMDPDGVPKIIAASRLADEALRRPF